jgi:hypothetical protein
MLQMESLEERVVLSVSVSVDKGELYITDNIAWNKNDVYLKSIVTNQNSALQWSSDGVNYQDTGLTLSDADRRIALKFNGTLHLQQIETLGKSLTIDARREDTFGTSWHVAQLPDVKIENSINTDGGNFDIKGCGLIDVGANVTISTRNIPAGADPLTANSEGVSGNISLKAFNPDPFNCFFNFNINPPKVVINSGARMLAYVPDAQQAAYQAGSIVVSASNINYKWFTTYSEIIGVVNRDAEVIFASANQASPTIVSGGSVDISTRAGENRSDLLLLQQFGNAYAEEHGGSLSDSWTNKIPFLSDTLLASVVGNILVGYLSGLVKSILTMPVSVGWRQASAVTNVGQNVRITARNDLAIGSTSEGAATNDSVYTDSGAFGDKMAEKKFGLAMGFSYAGSNATTLIQSGAALTSLGGNVNVFSNSTASSDSRSRVSQNVGVFDAKNTQKTTVQDRIQLAVAVGVTKNSSNTTLEQGASINASKKVEVESSGRGYGRSFSSTDSFYDGCFGGSITVNVNRSDVTTNINGNITSGYRGASAANLVFNPYTDIDFGTNQIHFSQKHDFATGARVYLNSNDQSMIPGLSPNTDYFAIKVDDNSIRLAASSADAIVGKAIIFGQMPTLGKLNISYNSSKPFVQPASPIVVTSVEDTVVDNSSGVAQTLGGAVSYPFDPGFANGDLVQFTPAKGQFIGGLGDGANPCTFRVIVAPDSGNNGTFRYYLVTVSTPQSQTEDNQQKSDATGLAQSIKSSYDSAYNQAYNNELSKNQNSNDAMIAAQEAGRNASNDAANKSGKIAVIDASPYFEVKSGSSAGQRVYVGKANPDASSFTLIASDAVKGLAAGDQIVYHAALGIQYQGLKEDDTYYAIPGVKGDSIGDSPAPDYPNTVLLATTYDGALEASKNQFVAYEQAQKLVSDPLPILTGTDNKSFTFQSVDASTDSIRFSSTAPFATGDIVTYKAVSNYVIVGLQDRQSYRVVRNPQNDSMIYLLPSTASSDDAETVETRLDLIYRATLSSSSKQWNEFNKTQTPENQIGLTTLNLNSVEAANNAIAASVLSNDRTATGSVFLAVFNTVKAQWIEQAVDETTAANRATSVAQAAIGALPQNDGFLAIAIGSASPAPFVVPLGLGNSLATKAALQTRSAKGKSLQTFNTSEDNSQFTPKPLVIVSISQPSIQAPFAGSKITLTATHGLKDGDAVICNTASSGNRIAGLISGKPYFVITDPADSLSFWLSERQNWAIARDSNKVAIISEPSVIKDWDSSAIAPLPTQANLNSYAGITILANNNFADGTTASTGIGKFPTLEKMLVNTEAMGIGQLKNSLTGIFKKINPIEDEIANRVNSGLSAPTIGIAGTVGVTISNGDTSINIGSNSVLSSNEDIRIQANATDMTRTTVESSISVRDGKENQKFASSMAVNVGMFNHDVNVNIADDATIDASRQLAVQANLTYPSGLGIPNPVASAPPDKPGMRYYNAVLAKQLQYFVANNWTKTSVTDGVLKGEASSSDYTIAGSVAYLTYSGSAKVNIGKARINQQIKSMENKTAYVAMNATTSAFLIDLIGNFEINVSISSIRDAFRRGWKNQQVFQPLGAQAGKGGLGASFEYRQQNYNTGVEISPGALIWTASGADGLKVNALTDAMMILVGSSGTSSGTGIGGIAATTLVNFNSFSTLAQIHSGAVIEGGPLMVSATDNSKAITVAGSLLKTSGTFGIGFSLIIQGTNRFTQAIIGETKDKSGPSLGNSTINVTGRIDVEAENKGYFIQICIGGTYRGNTPTDSQPRNSNALAFALNQDVGKFGIGVSGQVAIYLQTSQSAGREGEVAEALINTKGLIQSTGVLTVQALNDTKVMNLSGAISVNLNSDTNVTVGFAGAASVIEANQFVTVALIQAATVVAASLDLIAKNRGQNTAIAAGLAVAAGAEKSAVGVTGSVSLLNIGTLAEAFVNGSNITVSGDSTIEAIDTTFNLNVAGAFGYGSNAGAGAAVSINLIDSTVNSNATSSDFIQTKGNLTISALTSEDQSTREIWSVAGAVGASFGNGTSNGTSVGAAGMVTVNKLSERINAGFLDSNFKASNHSNLTIEANDNSAIYQYGGAVGVSRKFGFGFAFASNQLDQTVKSTTSGIINTKGSVVLSAKSDARVTTIVAGASASFNSNKTYGVALSGSAIVSNITNNIKSEITNDSANNASNVSATSVRLDSADNSEIVNGAGSLSFANPQGSKFKAAVGASVIKYTNSSTVVSDLNNSKISTPGQGVSIRLSALNNQNVTYGAAGGAISGDISVGGSLVLNDIQHNTDTSIVGSIIDGPLYTNAVEQSKIKGGAGTASIATDAIAAGFAVVINTIDSDVLNTIDRSVITSDSLAADAVSNMDVQAISLGLAVTTGYGERIGTGIGAVGSAAINKLDGSTVVQIKNNSNVTNSYNQATNLASRNTSQFEAIAGVLSIQTTITEDDKEKKKAVTTAIGASVARNLIGTDPAFPVLVKTEVLNSNINSRGGLVLDSLTDLNLKSGSGAGAGKFSGGGNSTVGFAGAGSYSDNEVAVDTIARLGNGTSVSSSDTFGNISLNAADNSSLLAVSGGVAFTGEIGGGAGFGVEVGAAIGYNVSKNHIIANLEGSKVLQSYGVILNATSGMDFKTYAIGVAGSISISGGSSIVSLQGAGSASRNIISNTIDASIKAAPGNIPSQVQNTWSISQKAIDQSTAYNLAGAIALGVQIFSGDKFSLPVGVSIALNEFTDSIYAKIQDSDISVTGSIVQDAIANLTLSSMAIAGTLGVTAGKNPFPDDPGTDWKDPDIGVTGAGADARNIVKNSIESGLANTRSMLKAAGFTSNATEQSNLTSNGGGVGVQITVGKNGWAASVGFAIARNEVTDLIQSSIDNSDVQTSSGLALNAESRLNAKSLGFGVALAGSFGAKAIALGGSGADSRNLITNTVSAVVGGNSTLTNIGNSGIAINAKDAPTLEANAGAGSLSVSVGAKGGALAVGAVIARNITTDGVSATVGRANANDNTVISSNGALNINANSKVVMKSTAVAVAAAAAFNPKGGAVSGSGADTLNQSNNNITASVEKGTIIAGSIAISAASRPNITTIVGSGAFSAGIYGGSIGISLAKSEVNDRISAYITSATANATSGDISLDTLSIPLIDTHVYATSASISIGVAGTGGSAASTDNSIVKSYLGANSKLATSGGLFIRSVGTTTDTTDNVTNIKSRSDGGNLGLATAGVSWSTVTSNPTINAFASDGLDLSKVGSLEILASSRANMQADSFAISVGGLAVTYNEGKAVNSGDVEAYTGRSVILPANVKINASGGAKMNASQMGVNAGLVGGGATFATIETSMKIVAKVGLNATMNAPEGSLSISASGNDDSLASAKSGSGGLASGFGTKSAINDTTQTTASIEGGNITTGSLNISSMHGHTYGLKVDAISVGIVAGVGVSIADFDCNSNVTSKIGNGTIITASDQINIATNNRLQNNNDGADVNGAGGSLLNSAAALSRSNVNANSIVEIGDNVKLYSGTDFFTRNGGIDISPSISFYSNDSAYVTNIGILASGSGIRSELKANLNNRVQIGSNVVLDTEGTLNVGSKANINSSTSTDCYGWGTIASGINSKSYNNVTLNQEMTAGSNLVAWAARDINLTPGSDPISGTPSNFYINSSATGKVHGAVAIPVTYAEAQFWNNSSLTVGANAKVESGRNMNLGAYYTSYTPTANSSGEGNILFWSKVSDDKKNAAYNSSVVSLQGSYTAGRNNRADIAVARNGNQFSNNVTITPSQTFDRPIAAVVVPNFDAEGYVDRTFNGKTAAVLKRGISSNPVTIVDLSPIFVSGGSINVKADTVKDGKATLSANVAQVNILNDSTDYLMVEDVQVGDVKGGDVTFSGKADESSVLGRWTINTPDRGNDPKITISNSYNQNLPNSDYGPALFIVGQISNNSGTVDIENKAGSFGVKDTISAGQINLNIPNGVVVIDTPNDPYSVVTNQRINDLVIWPGGKDASNPQAAVMYAINALYPNAGTANASLNEAVYGNYADVNSISTVFFGGSLPYHKVANGNGNDSLPENKRLSGNAWPGNAIAYKFGKGVILRGWLPSLVRTDTKFSSNENVNVNTRPTDGSAIFGDVVVINAKIVNINAPIVAGQDRKVNNWSLILDAAAQTKLDDYKKQYDSGIVSSAVYRIESQYSSLANVTDNRIGATFDASTGQITLDSISSSRGQSVSIRGEIVNTNPGQNVASMVKVSGGSGNITVTNNTKYPLVTENIETGSSNKALIEITDTLNPDVQNQQKLYVYDGQNITYYSGPADVVLSQGTPSAIYQNTSTAAYQPVNGSRWQWELEAKLTRQAEPRWINSVWDGFYYSDWKFVIPNGTGTSPWINKGGKPTSASIINNMGLLEFNETLAASVLKKSGLPSESVGGIPYGRLTYYPSEISITMTNSLKADWPINISFEGIGYGKVEVQSRGDLILNGTISSPDVHLVSQDSHIIQLSHATGVEASSVSLSAQQGIGSEQTPFVVSTGHLSATSTVGDIYLQANIHQENLPLLIGRIATTRNGQVSLISDGNILVDPNLNTPVLQGDEVNLVSRYGSIGSSLKPVTVEPAISSAANARTILNIDAYKDVYVVGTQGDILVEQVNSAQNGIVYLKSHGSIYNSYTWNVNPIALQDRISAFQKLGAFDINAWKSDLEAFKNSVNSTYQDYWFLMQNGEVVTTLIDVTPPDWFGEPIYEDVTVFTLKSNFEWVRDMIRTDSNPNPTDTQVQEKANQLYHEYASELANAYGFGWQNLPEFKTYQANYSYTPSAAIENRFKSRLVLTESSILSVFQKRALEQANGTAVPQRVNIKAGNILLASETGSIGKIDSPSNITVSQLQSGNLTESQKVQMYLADSPGDVREIKDSGNNTTALELKVRRQVVVQTPVTGSLDASAPAGITIEQPSGNLMLGDIRSNAGLVDITSSGSLLYASNLVTMNDSSVLMNDSSQWAFTGFKLNPNSFLKPEIEKNASMNNSAQELSFQNEAYSRNATWYKTPVPTSSFQVSFIYQSDSARNTADGLAFVLQNGDKPLEIIGNYGGALGYYGIETDKKVGFLINVYREAGTTFDITGKQGVYKPVPFNLKGRPVYVTLTYDASAQTLTSQISLNDNGGDASVTVYRNVNLESKLGGKTATMGFTSASGVFFGNQYVRGFRFDSSVADKLNDEQTVAFVAAKNPTEWKMNSAPGTKPFTWVNNELQFPDQKSGLASAWFVTPVKVNGNFEVSFDYLAKGSNPADGLSYVLQNSADGTKALGQGGANLGYGGILGKKVGYQINLYGTQGTRFDSINNQGGVQKPSNVSVSGNKVYVKLVYNANDKTLTEVISNDPLRETYKRVYTNVDLKRELGSDTAIMGFTASSGFYTATQTVSNFKFYAPATYEKIDLSQSASQWNLIGGMQTIANDQLTIPNLRNKATATWFTKPVSTASFKVSFDYFADAATEPGDGLAFVMQNTTAGINAIGNAGGDLGYKGIQGNHKVAYLINIYKTGTGTTFDIAGTTGNYNKINFSLTGRKVHVELRYDQDKKQLIETLTTDVKGETYTKTYDNIDISALLNRGNTDPTQKTNPFAYIGFTSGTGAASTKQRISNFIFETVSQIRSNTTATLTSWDGDIGQVERKLQVWGNSDPRVKPGSDFFIENIKESDPGLRNIRLNSQQGSSVNLTFPANSLGTSKNLQVSLKLSATSGSFIMKSAAGVTISNNGYIWTLSGIHSVLNNYLAKSGNVVYQPMAEVSGSIYITGRLSDGNSVKYGQIVIDLQQPTSPVRVQPVLEGITVEKGIKTDIRFLSVPIKVDPSLNKATTQAEVVVGVSAGTVSASRINGIRVRNNSKYLVLSGTIEKLASYLMIPGNLYYTSPRVYSGNEILNFSIRYRNQRSSFAMPILVNAGQLKSASIGMSITTSQKPDVSSQIYNHPTSTQTGMLNRVMQSNSRMQAMKRAQIVPLSNGSNS